MAQRINLPTYPFARDRYWLAAPAKPVALVSTPMASTNGHVEASVLSHDSDWLLVRETWTPEPLPADLDWQASVQRRAGQKVWVVAATREGADDLLGRIQQLVATVGLGSRLTVEAVLFAELAGWSVERAPDVVLVLGSGPDALKPIFALSRTLMREAWDSALRLYLAHPSSTTDPALEWEALSGFLRCAMVENPRHAWTCIGCVDAAAREDVRHTLLREWLADTSSVARFTELRYHGAERHVHRLAEMERGSSSPPLFRRGATYLITGGLGPVGALLCRKLAQAYQPRLVILSRGALDAAKQSECAALAALGAEVRYVSADVGDRAALGRALAQVKADVGPSHGVIHLARLVEDGLILSKSPESLDRVTRAKVDGTRYLDELTAAEPLEFFLLFSSMAAFGLRGASDYGYGAAFQNAFVRDRTRRHAAGQRSGRSVAIAWGPWSVDRYQPDQRDARMKAAGFDLISIEDAFAWLEHAAWPEEGFIGAMRVHDPERVRGDLGLSSAAAHPAATGAEPDPIEERIRTWELRKEKGAPVSIHEVNEFIRSDDVRRLSETLIERLHGLLIEGKRLPAPSVPLASPAPRGVWPAANGTHDLVEIIRQSLAEIIGVREVDVHRPFQDYGLDSVSGARFAILLEKRLSLKIPPSSILDHPTVHRLAAHLTAAATPHGSN